VAAWPELPEATKAGILAMVKAAKKCKRSVRPYTGASPVVVLARSSAVLWLGQRRFFRPTERRPQLGTPRARARTMPTSSPRADFGSFHAPKSLKPRQRPLAGVEPFAEMIGEAVEAAGGGGAALEALADDAAGLGFVLGDVAHRTAGRADAAVGGIDQPGTEQVRPCVKA
jgi:hypothetical protein